MAKSKIADAILKNMGKGGKPAEGGPEPAPEEDGAGMGLEAAMSDLAAALKSDDSAGAAEAFKTAHQICSGYSEE